MPCGHSDNGKAYEGYQRACILLAKNGMAVLCYDPIGQGERIPAARCEGKPAVRGTTEHTMAGIGALLVGRQLASYRIWDGLRALDYLAGRPEVDPTRLGCTGNSGGGTMTAYLMALDDRIAVAAPSCFITSLERLFATIGPQDAEQNITGQVAAGMEHADYVTLRAPKPTLLTVGTRDFFDIEGSWDTFREVKLIYRPARFRRAGRPVRVGRGARLHAASAHRNRALDEAMAPQEGRRRRRARFPDRRRRRAAMHPVGPGPHRLQGRVGVRFQRRSRPALQIARDARNAGLSDEDFRKEVERRLGLVGRSMSPVRAKVVETISRQGYKIRKLTFPVADVDSSMMVTALDISKDRSDKSNQPTLVEIGLSGKADLTAPGAIDALMGPAGRVVLLDPRGMGETDPAPTRFAANRRPATTSRKPSCRSTSTGRCSASAADILRVLAGLDGESGDGQDEHNGFRVVGIGTAGPIVLHAALLDRVGLIKEVVLEEVARLVDRYRRERDQPGPDRQRRSRRPRSL